MKIIILGAGQVGSTAAYHLAREEANDVTIVDRDPGILRELQDRLDVRTLIGEASWPDVLERAGAASADMLIALTNSDEINMVACQVAYTLFEEKRKKDKESDSERTGHRMTRIARVRASAYTRAKGLFTDDAVPVDVCVSPEELVTRYIEQLIHFPGAFQVLDFADGRVRLVGARAHRDGPLVGKPIRTLAEQMPDVETRIAAIYRNGQAVAPEGDAVILENDEVFFIAGRQDVRLVMSQLRRLDEPVRSVIIAGGGHIGLRLALALEQTNNVKIIERSRTRARMISERLAKAIVLHGDAADEDLLLEENIDSADIFVSLTNAEEVNILSAMLAKQLGCKKVMALINRPSYAELIESGTIDVGISPPQITIGALLTHVRRGDMVRVHTLRRGRAEALEAVVHGTEGRSKVIGRQIDQIKLPAGASISAILRNGRVMQAHHDTVVKDEDHVILFLSDRRQIEQVERLFQSVAG
jgi:trk system potassium uptake protein TrkA